MITLGGDAELELVDTLDPFSEGIVFRYLRLLYIISDVNQVFLRCTSLVRSLFNALLGDDVLYGEK